MAKDKQPTMPPCDAWASSDPLGEVLHTLTMSGVVYTRSHLSAPWGIDLPAIPDCLLFHVVTNGQCVLELKGQAPVTLLPGEFALVPHGQGHRIVHEAGAAAEPYFDLPIEHLSPRYEMLHYGGGGQATTLICGAVCIEHPAARDLIELLPDMIHIQTWSSSHADWMHSSLRLMAAEALSKQPGGETIVTRLADILVIQAIRTWLSENPSSKPGWIGALKDERIGPTLVEIHRKPMEQWTVATLAQKALMSRSAYSARFTQLVGMSPMQYTTRWRMQLAGNWLRAENITLAECANRLSYESEAAFSRAFKRVVGQAPGTWRKTQAAQ
tara:strand:- start:391 stop:1371 length:981 start_codon:yes stop_codon:yes gene_type:complete